MLFRSTTLLFVGFVFLAGVDRARAHVTLDAPNGGETLVVGSTYTVQWHIVISHTLLNWDLWYSTTGSGGPWITMAQNLPPGSGAVGSVHTYEWTIPDAPSDNVFVRVRMDNTATDYFDVSNAPLSIVTLTAPEPLLPDASINIAGDSVACAVDADCEAAAAATSVCRGGSCYMRKGRFVSVSPNPANAGMLTARRVCIDAPGPGAHCRWVGAPGPPITYIGPGPQPILTANLLPVATGTAVYRDWSTDPVDSHGHTVVHIGGCAVSNGHDYYIQAINQGSDEADEASYSSALILPTTGDVFTIPQTGGFGDVNGNTVSAIDDIFAMVKGFQGTQNFPRTWLTILPSGNDAADPGAITLAEALSGVRAFQGQTYLDQPGASTPVDCP